MKQRKQWSQRLWLILPLIYALLYLVFFFMFYIVTEGSFIIFLWIFVFDQLGIFFFPDSVYHLWGKWGFFLTYLITGLVQWSLIGALLSAIIQSIPR